MRKLAPAALALAATGLGGGGAEASGGGAAISDLHLVPMDEITVPIIDADRVDGSLRMKLVLQAGDERAALDIAGTMPDVRAAAISAALEFGRLRASGLHAVNASELGHELQTALKAADPRIQRVLIVEVEAAQG